MNAGDPAAGTDIAASSDHWEFATGVETMKKTIAVLAMSVLAAGQASAVPITYTYTTDPASQIGNVPELSALFDGLSITGTFVYDSETPLTTTQPGGLEIYVGAVTGWTGTVGGNSFSDANDTSLAVSGDDTFDFGGTLNDFLLFSMGPPGSGAADGFSIGGFTLDNVRMFWIENLLPGVPDFISGSGLIDPLPDFAGRMSLDFGTIERDGITLPVNVFFDNVIVTRVAEPGSLLLLLGGLVMLALRRRLRPG